MHNSLTTLRYLLKFISNLFIVIAILNFTVGALALLMGIIKGIQTQSLSYFLMPCLNLLLLYLIGLVFYCLGRGLKREEKWAWVVSSSVFLINFLVAAVLLFLKQDRFLNLTFEKKLGVCVFQLSFLILLLSLYPFFKEKKEKITSWFLKKDFKIVFASIIIIYIASLSSFIYIQWWVPHQTKAYLNVINSITTLKDQNSIIAETAGWNSYFSSLMKFSVKYPPDWKIVKETAQKRTFLAAGLNTFIGEGNLVKMEGKEMALSIYRGRFFVSTDLIGNKKEVTFDELISMEHAIIERKARNGENVQFQEKHFEISGIPAVRFTLIEVWPRFNTIKIEDIAYLEYEGEILRIQCKTKLFALLSKRKEYVKIFNLIMSTFYLVR